MGGVCFAAFQLTLGCMRLALGNTSYMKLGANEATVVLNRDAECMMRLYGTRSSGLGCLTLRPSGVWLLAENEFLRVYISCVQEAAGNKDSAKFSSRLANLHCKNQMAVLCGMPTIQYSARSARLSVRLSKWACPKITSGQSNLT